MVCPGSLAEQWQDELYQRFHLNFEIFTNDKAAVARTGNWFLETDLVIARLDKLARDGALQEKLEAPDCRWDLVVCDEAHKMSATFTDGEIRYTKRYRLGQLLGGLTRHLLLLTATPHNGKEEDFQLFMALLDGDRFEGRFRDGVHAADVSDLMRRMVKERLLTFESTPLFPERVAHTIPYRLSVVEAHLYQAVTSYVREEFNRAEALENNGRAGAVGIRPDPAATAPRFVAGGDLPVPTPAPGAFAEPLARAGTVAPRRQGYVPVKGRVHDADTITITVTRNEILYSLNKPDDYRLAIVEFLAGDSHRVHYLSRPFHRQPTTGLRRQQRQLLLQGPSRPGRAAVLRSCPTSRRTCRPEPTTYPVPVTDNRVISVRSRALEMHR